MCSSTPSFETSLDLNDSGSSSTSPSRLPRMLVEYQPSRPSMRALKPGARIVFISVWPVLKSLPQIGMPLLLGQLLHRREVDRQVRRAVGVRHARAQARVGVDRRRRDVVVAVAQALLELRERRVHVATARGRPRSSRTTPRRSGRRRCVVLKRSMSAISCSARSIFDVPFLTLVPCSFLTYVGSNTPGIGWIVSRNGRTFSRSSLDEHAGVLGRLVGVVLEDVPAAEHHVVERRPAARSP